MSDLCASLDEHQVVLLGLFLSLLGSDLALVVQIGLVAYEYDDNVGAALTTNIVDPFASLLEGLGRGDIVDDHGNAAVADVGGDQTAEALLASGIPELQTNGAVLEVHGLRNQCVNTLFSLADREWKIATFDKKSIPIVAWYVLSNESYMKRVIRDVLPTRGVLYQ